MRIKDVNEWNLNLIFQKKPTLPKLKFNKMQKGFLKVFFKQFDYDRVVNPEMDQNVSMVDECTECGECIERCPYELDIITMIRENRDYYLARKEKEDGSDSNSA